MKKFEYETFNVYVKDEEKLKEMGDSGWELVSVALLSWDMGHVQYYRYFFKREVE